MVIEFYTPKKEVEEWLITYIRDAILKQHKQHTEISRAEVYFKERIKQAAVEKICEISLSIFKNAVTVTGTAKSFDIAARKAVEAMNGLIALNFKTNTEVPDEIVSTVNV